MNINHLIRLVFVKVDMPHLGVLCMRDESNLDYGCGHDWRRRRRRNKYGENWVK